MSFVHGRNTFVSLNAQDLSTFTTSTENNNEADSHDVTTYGQVRHQFNGGLLNGTITISGIYDNTASTGPRPVIKPLVGQITPFVFQPEGAGAGLPSQEGDVLVTAYNESSPVAEMVTWTAELQTTGTWQDTVQI